MCERKKKEPEELNQQISNVLNDDEDALEVELEEAEKIYLQVDCLMEMITTMLDDRVKYSTESVKDDDSSSGTGSYKPLPNVVLAENKILCLKLPKLNSPTFSGRYDQWLPFLDSFDGAVHSNASLSDVQKLQYLKGALKDEPFCLLSNLPTTNANYSVARELLKDRYADVKMISHAHLEAIFEFTPMKHESSAAIRRLINTYTENTMALAGLGLKIDQCDLIWVHVLAKKLDPETRRQWELSCAGSDVPKIKQMKKFLEERYRALEATKDLQLPSIRNKEIQTNLETLRKMTRYRHTTQTLLRRSSAHAAVVITACINAQNFRKCLFPIEDKKPNQSDYASIACPLDTKIMSASRSQRAKPVERVITRYFTSRPKQATGTWK